MDDPKYNIRVGKRPVNPRSWEETVKFLDEHGAQYNAGFLKEMLDHGHVVLETKEGGGIRVEKA